VQQPSPRYKRHRFPGALISQAVWLYYRFLLSFRDVEELLAERGITVSYETIRRWCRTFGQTFADAVRRRRPRRGDKWHVDAVQRTINGRTHWLWRAVDQDAVILDILVQSRRSQEAAETFLRRLIDGHKCQPRVVNGQAGQRPTRDTPWAPAGRAPAAHGAEQPGSEFAPADPPTGAGAPTVHVPRARSAVPRSDRPHR
jgi:transposase-like protein